MGASETGSGRQIRETAREFGRARGGRPRAPSGCPRRSGEGASATSGRPRGAPRDRQAPRTRHVSARRARRARLDAPGASGGSARAGRMGTGHEPRKGGTIVWTPRRTHLASLGGRAYLVRRYHRAGDDRGRHGAVVVVLRARVARSRVSSRGARVMRSRPRLPRSLTRRAIGHNSGKAPPRTIAILIFSAEGGRG